MENKIVINENKKNITLRIKHWFLEDKMRIATLAWIIFSITIGVISSLNTITLTNDDTSFVHQFEMSNGFWKTVYKLLFNLDLASKGEMRTYGISKVIQFLLYHIARDKAWIYQFVITCTHLLSGIIVYKILKRLKVEILPSALAVIAFTLNPFCHVQTFHHWSYLMLPLYFVLFYIYIELGINQMDSIETKKYTLKRHLLSLIIILFTVFTGEYTLAMLACAICFFGIYNIVKKNRKLTFRYLGHLLLECTLALSWFALWKNVLSENEVGRFVIQKPNLGLFKMFTASIISNFKRFLFISESNKLDMGQDSVFSVCIALLVILVIGVTVIITYICFKDKISENNRISRKTSILIICFAFSSLSVYVVLNIFCYAGMSYHYFYSIFSLFTVAFVIVLCTLFNNKKTISAIIICLLLIFTGYNVVWYGYLKPTTAQVDKKIISQLEAAAKDGKKTLVVLMKDTVYGEVLLDSKCYRPLSTFSSGWTSQKYLNPIFDDVVYINYNTQITTNGNNTITLKGEKVIHGSSYATDNLTFNKEDIFFICNDSDTGARTYYSDIDDYLNKENLKIYSANKNYNKNYALVFSPPILYIDVGDKNMENKLIKDKAFSEENRNTINYGYLAGDSSVYSVDGDIKIIGKVFKTNRYSPTSFTYKFTQLPEEKDLSIIVDIVEFWHKKAGERLFDIIVESDCTTSTYRDIDPYALSLNKETGEISPLRLAINLSKTKQASITFVSKKGYDVATIHGIGIIEN